MTGLAEARRSSSTSDHALEEFEQHRRELTGFCYRMLGSAFDAEDAVQETLVRAWKGFDAFQGRASVRSWLYRIATNVCLTMLEQSGRRAVPMDFGTASEPVMASLGEPRPESTWITPMPDERIEPQGSDPAEVAVVRESVRLAFVAALQHLPPRQRAVLILREVLRWRADEVAELLGTSTASVNSALQRARATMAADDVASRRLDPLDQEHAALLAGYVDAFERYDMDALVTMLYQDVIQNMPPFALWLRGPADVVRWMLGPGSECRGSRLLPVQVNGGPGLAQYRPSGRGGRHEPWALHAIEIADARIVGVSSFLDTRLFELFGLPAYLD